MKRYRASKAREQLAGVLDEAERNGSVMIERGDVQYIITVKRRHKRSRIAPTIIEIVDPAVAAGEWGWQWTAAGARFRPATRRRR